MKLKSILQNRKLYWLWALALSAGLGYSMYSFRYEFLDWSNLPLVGFYAVLSGVCFAGAFVLLWSLLRERRKPLAFLCAFAGFQIVLWVILTVVNAGGLYNRLAVNIAFAVLFALYAVILLLTFLRLSGSVYKLFSRILAVVFCAAFLIAAVYPVIPTVSEFNKMMNFTSNINFSSITASAMRVTEDETDSARTWFEEHVLFNGSGAPAFDFRLDGDLFSEHTADWDFTAAKVNAAPRGGVTERAVTATHKKSGVTLRVMGKFYEAHATMEYTVYLKNTGTENSPVISDFYALTSVKDLIFEDPAVFCSSGSHDSAADFTLYRVKNPEKAHVFTGTNGRPSDEYMPYFNVCGKDAGVVLGIGWSGQWKATLACKGDKTQFDVCQQTLKGYLLPGEEIRSPLVSLSMYTGGNPVKGFNLFRSWVLERVYPENTPHMLNNMDVLFVSHTRTAQEIKNDIGVYSDALLSYTDNFWMDAGWYDGCVEGWYDGNGNWKTNAERFPKGIKEISDIAAAKGLGLLLWYEPERLVHGSALYQAGQENPQYIIDLSPEDKKNRSILWNLADDGACAYLTKYIGASLKENGVTFYRQDFNIDPLEFWEYADANYYGGRKGICENHYVSNLYKYLDGLFDAVPGLVMDNCSSGGRRLDLELTHRSIPLWRTDYNCAVHPDSLEADQAHTYGLSFWQPVNGANVDFSSEYGARSSIFCGQLYTSDSGNSPYFGAYDEERAMLVKNFYPISFGGVKPGGVTAMQYGDEKSGMALIYKHEKAASGDYALMFSGLDETVSYKVCDTDTPENEAVFSGAELMQSAFHVAFPTGKKAIIVRYEAVK